MLHILAKGEALVMAKFIIPVIVGAVIGYITNWLAIKMLFRPYTEKRFFGFKIPFTPGLIPKERERIAKSVGETVGNHLLSPEMIVDSLGNDEVAAQIEKWIEQRIDEFKESDINLREWIKASTGSSYEKLMDGAETVLGGIVVKELQNKDNQKRIIRAFENVIFEGKIVDSDLYYSVRGKFRELLNSPGFLDSAKTASEEIVSRALVNLREKDGTLGDIISPALSNSAKVYIYNHKEDIADLLKDILNDEKVHDKLKGNIAALIELNFGKFVTMFMNPENIAIKIIVAVINYLNKPENQDNIALVGVKFIDILLEKRVSEIINEITYEVQRQVVEETGSLISNFVTKECNQELIISLLENKLVENESEIRENISIGMLNVIGKIADSNEFKNNVYLLIHEGTEGLLNMQVSEILSYISESGVSSVKKLIMDIIKNFINNKADYLASLLNVPKIVEDRINGFDVEFAEKLILDVARKELSAITWLGALLGAIMGIISPLLELLTH